MGGRQQEQGRGQSLAQWEQREGDYDGRKVARVGERTVPGTVGAEGR